MKTRMLGILLLLPLAVHGQSIAIKTVPVAEGQQFLLFPSAYFGPTGASIALDDPLGAPYVNPAKGVYIERLTFLSSPAFYAFDVDRWDQNAGSGRTLPVGLLVRHGAWFGGATLAWQELTTPQQAVDPWFGGPGPEVLTERPTESRLSQSNRYGFAMAGYHFPGTGLSVGGSAFLAGLRGLEGVRLLYWDGNRIQQNGDMGLYRVGVFWQDAKHTLEGLLAHHRFSMRHTTNRWLPDEGRFGEHREYDETRGWAARIGYRYLLPSGWVLGGQLTGDWKHHPKIPNYDLMQIPRDPGHSTAFNVGLGLARRRSGATIAADLVFEPIRSHTWANAAEEMISQIGTFIPAGAKTVDNQFRFENMRFRLGFHQQEERWSFGFGLDAHHISYRLEQIDLIRVITRTQDESWTEWTLSGRLGRRFEEFAVHYTGLLSLGTGRPGTDFWGGGVRTFDDMAAEADFIPAPNGSLFLQETRVFTHQLTLTVPL